jgi:hypothetical protein
MNFSRQLLTALFTPALNVVLTFAADVEVVHPKRIVDLQEMTGKLYSRSDFSSVNITQANGRWAVLLDSGANEGIVVKGDFRSEQASVKCGAYDSIAMDAAHRIYLRHNSMGLGKSTRVRVEEWETENFTIQEIPAPKAEPYLSGKRLIWKARSGFTGSLVSESRTLGWAQATGPFERPELVEQADPAGVYVMGLPQGGRVELGRASEIINLFGSEGNLRSVASADLDAAYRVLERSHPKAPGRLRMLWASSSAEGLLYVCLTAMPMARGAHIAVIRPQDGGLVKIVRAILPTAVWRRDRYNPEGAIFPSPGAVDDRLVIMDKSLDIVGLY